MIEYEYCNQGPEDSERAIMSYRFLTLFLVAALSGVGYCANTFYVSLDGRAEGATGTIDDPFPTIQDGLTAADNWDTVLVKAGTYKISSPLTVAKVRVNLKSQSGERDVIVDAENTGPIADLKVNYVTLAGLIFQNGTGTVAAVTCGTSATISNCCVRNCHVVTTANCTGGGLTFGNNSTVCDTLVENCILEDGNPSGSTTCLQLHGGGIGSGVGGSICNTVVSNCLVKGYCDQGTYPLVGGGIYADSMTVENCKIFDCEVTNTANVVDVPTTKMRGGFGGGLYLKRFALSWPAPVLRNCLIRGNRASWQAAGAYVTGQEALVENCTFEGNVLQPITNGSAGGGSGLMVNVVTGIVRNCCFTNNSFASAVNTTYGGGALAVLLGTDNLKISDCLIVDNVGANVGGLALEEAKNVTVSNCVIRGNGGSQFNNVGGVYVFCGVNNMIADSWIVDNVSKANSAAAVYGWSISNGGDVPAVTLRNCLIRGNQRAADSVNELSALYWWAWTGAEKYNFYKWDLLIENCTIVSNLTTASNGYVLRARGSDSGLTNMFCRGSVIYGNGSTGKLGFKDDLSALPGRVKYTYAPDHVSTDPADGNIIGTDDPGFVNAAAGDYRPVSDKCLLAGKVPYADWMGDRKTKDLGDGTYTVKPCGTYGVSIVRNNPVQRAHDGFADIGCFEYKRSKGLMLLFR